MKRKTVMYSVGDTALKGNTRWQHHMLERWVRNSSFTLHMGDAESSLKLLTERRHLQKRQCPPRTTMSTFQCLCRTGFLCTELHNSLAKSSANNHKHYLNDKRLLGKGSVLVYSYISFTVNKNHNQPDRYKARMNYYQLLERIKYESKQ